MAFSKDFSHLKGILNGETATDSSSAAELQGSRLGSQDLVLRAQGFELTLHHLWVIELRGVKAIDISTSFHMWYTLYKWMCIYI